MSSVIVVAKTTAYAEHVLQRRDPEAIRLLDAGDPSVARWRQAHSDHERTLGSVLTALARFGVDHVVVPARTGFDATGVRLVVTVGGDGTLLSASHHVGSAAVLGVNSSTAHSIGFFCAANADNVERLLRAALDGTAPNVRLSRMQVSVGDRVCSKRVLNEALFCHVIPAATSRYIIEVEGQVEEQRSSGVWVGTAAGSTGAVHSAGGDVLPFSSPQLQLVVREPYPGPGRSYQLLKVIAEPGQTLALRSKMHDARLFLDGPFACFDVGLGEIVRCQVSDEPLTLLGLDQRQGRAKLD